MILLTIIKSNDTEKFMWKSLLKIPTLSSTLHKYEYVKPPKEYINLTHSVLGVKTSGKIKSPLAPPRWKFLYGHYQEERAENKIDILL